MSKLISLGSFCQTMSTLKRLGINQERYPFDFIRSNPNIIMDCIKTDFKTFLNKNLYIKGKVLGNVFYGHEVYGYDLFAHTNIFDDKIYSSLIRRCKRFTELLKSNQSKIFFIIFTLWDEKFKVFINDIEEVRESSMFDSRKTDKIRTKIKELYDLLESKTNNFKIISIINLHPAYGEKWDNERKIIFDFKYKNIENYLFYSKECSLGMTYNPEDEIILHNFMKQYIT